VFMSAALDGNGEPLFEVLNTATFVQEGSKTKLTLHARATNIRPDAARHIAGMEMGWSMALDRLGAELRGEMVE